MNEEKANWSFYEFRVYLLLYVANADFELKEVEKERILADSNGKQYLRISKEFEEDSDYERIQTIQSFREQFFPTEEDIDRLIREIGKLLIADDEFNLYEKNFFRMLQKILRNN